jgi:MFS family permease
VTEEPLFDFAVPDDLLRDAVAQARDPEAIAELELMPGTGEGKPPSLIGILRNSGYAPLVLMTAAALVPGTFGNGINLIGHNLEVSFHMSNASLGAVAFVAQVSQLLWAVPLALWADRGSRRTVAGVALLIFAVFGAAMALSPNVWAFAFLYLAASVGSGVNNTVHNSYLSDAYPTEGRGRIFSWHNLSDPISQTVGILIFGFVVTVAHSWRYGLLVALAGIPLGFALFTLREPEKGANESSHILKASGMDLHSQQEKAPRVLLGSAVTRLLRIRSLYYELVAVAILGFVGTGSGLFGNLFLVDKFHLDTASRSDVYAIIGLAAFLGLPLAYVFGDRFFRQAPQRPLVIAGFCISGYGILFALRAQALDVRGAAVLGQRRRLAAGHLYLHDPGRHGAPGDADDLLRHVRRLLLGLRRLRRLRGPGGRVRRHRRAARHRRLAHHHSAGVRGGGIPLDPGLA